MLMNCLTTGKASEDILFSSLFLWCAQPYSESQFSTLLTPFHSLPCHFQYKPTNGHFSPSVRLCSTKKISSQSHKHPHSAQPAGLGETKAPDLNDLEQQLFPSDSSEPFQKRKSRKTGAKGSRERLQNNQVILLSLPPSAPSCCQESLLGGREDSRSETEKQLPSNRVEFFTGKQKIQHCNPIRQKKKNLQCNTFCPE